jgi:aspartate/methionine/tyrosine aminotransferase
VTFAKRVQEVEPFLAVEVAERAQELERSGIDVVHLEFGEPDFEAPPVVRDALERAIKDGRTRYAHSLGILPLREAIAEHYAGTYGRDGLPGSDPRDRWHLPGDAPALRSPARRG